MKKPVFYHSSHGSKFNFLNYRINISLGLIDVFNKKHNVGITLYTPFNKHHNFKQYLTLFRIIFNAKGFY